LGLIARYQDYGSSPYGRNIIGYRHLLDILPLVCRVDQVMIPGSESRPTLTFLSTPIPDGVS
jgi:hypothetical protein